MESLPNPARKPVKEMTYQELLVAQQELRQRGAPTIPFIYAPYLSYPDAEKISKLVSSYGLEPGISLSLGGITVFIDSEDDFVKFQKLMLEHQEFSYQLPT